MASKRNARLYVDETKHSEEGRHKVIKPVSHRPRRDSLASAKDHVFLDDDEEWDDQGALEKGIARPRSRTRASNDAADGRVTGLAPARDLDAAPTNSRCANFGEVEAGIFRSSYPKPAEYGFLKSLKLKTIV